MLKLFKGLKPYWTLVIGVLVLVFISTLTDLELPDLMSDIVDTGIVQGDVSYILGRGGVMLLVALLGTVCTILTSYLSSKIGMGFSRDLRKKVFEKVFEEDIDPVSYIEEHGLKIVEDTGLLNDTLQKILDENPGPLEELLGGKEKVFGFFVGKMMRELKGKASPDAVREALVKEVEKRKNQ